MISYSNHKKIHNIQENNKYTILNFSIDITSWSVYINESSNKLLTKLSSLDYILNKLIFFNWSK
jgi:hypothetical protein